MLKLINIYLINKRCKSMVYYFIIAFLALLIILVLVNHNNLGAVKDNKSHTFMSISPLPLRLFPL